MRPTLASPIRVRVADLRPGGRHAVRPGESLWHIARALLPAGASNAAIAAMTERLWALNAARIGTGSPDELPVGVILHLRSHEH